MNLEDFLKSKAPGWMDVKGLDADIVLSTRIRLARNLDGFRFPLSFTEQEAQQVNDLVTEAVMALNTKEKKFTHFAINEMPALQRQVLVEKHLISPLLAKKEKSASVLLSNDETVSLMVNEEDHLRIQCLTPGLQIMETYEKATKIDNELEKELPYAFNEQFGYLTSCPTNVGTGLRASVMMHLPALTMSKKIKVVTQMLARLGMVVRGIYGEGSENLGNIYQISNQVTLGRSEEEILEDLQEVAIQIIKNERGAREALLKNSRIVLEDRFNRSLGTLKYAHILTTEEAAACLSNVRLGVDTGIIQEVPLHVLNECMILLQPGFVQQYAGTTLQANERDIYRAKLLREKFQLKNQKQMEKGEERYDV